MIAVFEKVYNIVEKEEIVAYQHFLLFHSCQKASFSDGSQDILDEE